MARKNVRVDVPIGSPEGMFTLAERIIEKHKELGGESPLKRFDMKAFETLLAEAKADYLAGKKLHEQAEAKIEKAYALIGIADGQTSRTPGTMYKIMTLFRDELLLTHEGNEEQLSEWGFNVVVSESTPRRRNQSEDSEDES